MQTIEFDKKITILLDHCELINKIYNRNENVAQKYFLRPEIFDFHAPLQSAEITADNDPCSVHKTKRKRKLKKEPPTARDQEQQDLHTFLDTLIQLHKSHANFPRKEHQTVARTIPLPRYWEETDSYEFPRFNGANMTNDFQRQQFATRTYLIPPQCRFFNADILLLTQLLPQLSQPYDLIVLDPPWRNKYVRRVKRARREFGYQMIDTEQLQKLPIAQLAHKHSLVAIWCTNSQRTQEALLTQLLPAWELRLLHKVHWFKLNTIGTPIHPINTVGHKQPYEMLYLACHKQAEATFGQHLCQVAAILSVPSIVHSHKPPLLPWLRKSWPEQPQCLELFARYLQPHFTSIGLEVLKLMDTRLYECS